MYTSENRQIEALNLNSILRLLISHGLLLFHVDPGPEHLVPLSQAFQLFACHLNPLSFSWEITQCVWTSLPLKRRRWRNGVKYDIVYLGCHSGVNSHWWWPRLSNSRWCVTNQRGRRFADLSWTQVPGEPHKPDEEPKTGFASTCPNHLFTWPIILSLALDSLTNYFVLNLGRDNKQKNTS